MTTDADGADEREPLAPEGSEEPEDSDADPGQMPHRAHVSGAVDGVVADDTDPGADPDGDPEQLRSGS